MEKNILKATKFPLLQVGRDEKTYRILVSVQYIRYLEEKLGRKFQQGEPWELSLLEDELGIKAVPLK